MSKTCGYEAELDTAVEMLSSCSPSQGTKKKNIQRNSKAIYNKENYY